MKILYFLFSVLLLSCSATSIDDNMAHLNWPERSVLMENFRQQDSICVIYGKEDGLLAEAIIAGISGVGQINDRIKILIKRDDEVTQSELTKFPLYIIGTINNLLVKRLDENMPVNFTERGFIFDNKEYTDKSGIIKISLYPNLFNPQLPLTLIAANSEENLIEYVKDQFTQSWGYFFWDSWGYQVYEKGNRIVMGNFSEDKATLWSIDKKLHWDFSYDGVKVKEDKNIQFYTHSPDISMEKINALELKTVSDLDALEKFIGIELREQIKFHIYPSPEIKTLMRNNPEQANIDFETNTLHTVIDQEYTNMFSESPCKLALRKILGEPEINALETGLAIKFTKNWQGTDYKLQAKHLLDATLLPDVKTLLDNNSFNERSSYLMKIAAASFVDYLITESPIGNSFVKDYPTLNSSELLKIPNLEQDWKMYVTTQSSDLKNTSPSIPTDNNFLKGFNFAHEGYQVYNGYLGSEADRSIKKLKEIGVNSITIIPYSGFRSMTKPAPIEFSNSAGSENDASIIHSAYEAHQNGMSVMIKPQLWSWLGWTGDITMGSQKDWDLFFEYYEQWIIHYALMAELYDVEMFCIGVEFQNASLSEHNKWDDLFDKVRKIYSGKITYAANWGTEFETVSFWDKLDYISVNCYYPLSAKTDPTDAELLAAFEKNLDIIERVHIKYNLPVLFTEIGFKSIAAPWINPHKDADEQDYSEDAQKRCYSIMQQAMADEDWIKGVYFWKWPSYMQYSDEYNKDFTPCGKEAEAVIKNWFLGNN